MPEPMEKVADPSARVPLGSEALAALYKQLARLQADAAGTGGDRAAALCALEREAVALLCRSEASGGSKAARAAVSQALCRIVAQAEEAQESAALHSARGLLARLHGRGVARWLETADCFLETAAVEGTEPSQRIEGALALLRQATDWESSARAEGLEDVAGPDVEGRRASLRRVVVDLCAGAAPDRALQQREAHLLLDRADEALARSAELSPARGVAVLDLVRSELGWQRRTLLARSPRLSRALLRRERRLAVESQELFLQGRLEGRFGRARVAAFERLVFGLVLLVLGILIGEALFRVPPGIALALAVADTLACGVFLTEFFVKLRHVRGRTSWFLRHALIDLLPSIPFGLIALGTLHPDGIRAVRALRFLRLARVARYVRVVLPVLRLLRVLGFLARGLDHLARRHRRLLDRDVILFPNRSERHALEDGQESSVRALSRFCRRLSRTQDVAWDAADASGRRFLHESRLEGLESALTGLPDADLEAPPAGDGSADLTLDGLIDELDSMTPERVSVELEASDAERLAHLITFVSRPPWRWLPVLRHLALPGVWHRPAAATVSAVAHRAAALLRRYQGRILSLADLHGVVTPAELVDRVGTTLVKATIRPASRLLLLGLLYLLVQVGAALFGAGGTEGARGTLRAALHLVNTLLGSTLMVLGSLCLVVLGVGWWMRRLAGRATASLEQIAGAQHLALMEAIKGRTLSRSVAILDARVLAPAAAAHPEEVIGDARTRRAAFEDTLRRWLVAPRGGGGKQGVGPILERVVLLVRDNLDGGVLLENDVRTTDQLLGDPALKEATALSRRLPPWLRTSLRRLDPRRRGLLAGGPGFWLSLVARAVAQAAARRIVDYNRNAISLAELPLASPEERDRYRAWLEGSLPPVREESATVGFVTSGFVALNFLDDDPELDRQIEAVYGGEVLRRLSADRRALFREIFGTWPRHLSPREDRVVNLYRLYERYAAGGWIFLLPLRWAGRSVRNLGRLIAFVARAVAEVRRPRRRAPPGVLAASDFPTALRKIDRMRWPIVQAALELRAHLDPEYLGLPLPGLATTPAPAGDLETDLTFVGASPAFARRLDAYRARSAADLQRLSRLLDEGLLERVARRVGTRSSALTAEHSRAVAWAYAGDFEQVRTLLSAPEILEEEWDRVLSQPPAPRPLWPRLRLRRELRRFLADRGRCDRQRARLLWRAVVANRSGSGDALRALARHGSENARARGEENLARHLRHPRRLSTMLLTLRAVQSLSLIDLLTYREHVWRLGGYEASERRPGHLLSLGEGSVVAEGESSRRG